MKCNKLIFYILLFLFFLFQNIIIAQNVDPSILTQQSKITTTPQTQKKSIPVQAEPGLPTFGLALFEDRESETSISGSYILPPDYKLGPGDKIGIYILGEKPVNFEVIINVEGKIFIPSIGVVAVSGLRLGQFKASLNEKLSKFYDNFSFDIMLLMPKNIEVVVVGDVKKPGKHIVNALNTVLDVVLLAGGPTEKGSMRNIQLFRKAKQFAAVDLYQFLMQGESQNDIYLESGDRIFVPLRQSSITVMGEVKRPAIFELKPDVHERLSAVIKFAGDFTEFAYLPKIEISRLKNDGSRVLHYINYEVILQSDSCEANIVIRNGDNVRVYSKLELLHQCNVTIYGKVRRPGKYRWQENMHISDLILQSGNLTRSAYMLEAELARIDPLKPAGIVKVKLQDIINHPHSSLDLILEEDDKIFIREIPEWLVGPTVEIAGEVMFPGVYPITKDSTTLVEIINEAGDFTKEALIRDAAVIRKSAKISFDKEYERLKEMRAEEMSKSEYQYFVMKRNMQDVGQILVDFHKLFVLCDQTEDILLEKGDIIKIPKAPVVVQVTGRVAKPGGVLFKKGANLKYYLEKAGGITWDADVKNTKVSKVTGEIIKYTKVDEYVPGDIIWVPRKPYRDWWAIFRDTVAVVAQIATILLIIQNVQNNQ